MATMEVTNRVFRRFDPAHDSRVEPKHCYQFGVRGLDANRPEQPVVRVSYERAEAFCRWLSERTGEAFDLPTDMQWEYACRAGSAGDFSFGELGDDFSAHANLADVALGGMASDPYTLTLPIPEPSRFDDWIPRDARWNDGALLAVAGGSFSPNAWGLFDMHGNVAEWTRGSLHAGERNVRGGSWRDRPQRATATARQSYPVWQRVFNVGFRVVATVRTEDSR
jgi:formylglycine-generating enzyme required for sulfatase activity